MGLVRIFPRVMVYTSKKNHELRLNQTWYNQQLKHLQTLIGETINKSLTGISPQDSTELSQLGVGLSGTFKNVPKKNKTYPYINMTNRPVLFLRRQWHITSWPITTTTTTTTNRSGVFLMLCFMLAHPTTIELLRLMACREYLQVKH